MGSYLEKLPAHVEAIRALKATIVTNIVLVGQIPAPTFREQRRAHFFLERLAECHADECTTDGYGNPIGIVRGTSRSAAPIFVVAHLDTVFDREVDHNFTVQENTVTGAGILDNSVGIGVLLSLPEIFKQLDLKFNSDIILAGVVQSIGKGNLAGIRYLVESWGAPIRGAVCIEGIELGRISYYADGMLRCEVECRISQDRGVEHKFKPNAILILNEVINQILQLRLPQRPRSRVIIGRIAGGFKHGEIALEAKVGFEIQSDLDSMVQSIFTDIKDIVEGMSHEHQVELKLNTLSSINVAKLRYNHPLVKSTVAVMKHLGLAPVNIPSEAELTMFLSHHIPAVTLGVTRGQNYHLENASMEIEPLFKGIAQIIGVITAIDSGVCDE